MVLIFSANRQIVNLILTFNLEIDYNGNNTETQADYECDISSDIPILPDPDQQDPVEDEEEGGNNTPTNGTLPFKEIPHRHAGRHSEGYGTR